MAIGVPRYINRSGWGYVYFFSLSYLEYIHPLSIKSIKIYTCSGLIYAIAQDLGCFSITNDFEFLTHTRGGGDCAGPKKIAGLLANPAK